MLRNIPLGIYFPGKSFLHRLQARTKLLLVVWFAACLTHANRNPWHFAPYIVLAILVLLGIALSGISIGQFWLRIRLLLLFTLIAAIPVLFTVADSGSKPLYPIGPFAISFGFVRWAIYIYGILLLIFIALSLLPIEGLHQVMQRRVFKRLRIWFSLLTIVALLTLWFIRNIPPARTFPAGPFVITDTGVWSEVTLFTVFLVLYTCSLLLTMTTTPIALIEGTSRLLAPLRRLRLPVDEFALMMLIALRFIPTLFEELELLLKAQTSRGADYAHGTIRERVQSMIALFVPFLQGVLRRASDLATALEARGYQVEGRQTYLHETSLHMVDYITLGTVLVLTVGALLL